jgi:nucleoside 2-deoxyribosyltransferase
MSNHPVPSAYLAGPDVFFPDAKALAATKKAILLQVGITGHFPLDNEIPQDSGQRLEIQSHDIFLQNVALIDRCDIVLANIIPFRGPSLDPGTAWEIGYAHARGIPVICYGTWGTYLERCRHAGLEGPSQGKDINGFLIEDFNQMENLMITRCASLIVESFEEAAAAAAKILLDTQG